MRVITWNVNGIRAREAEVLELLEKHRPDVLCMQEIKATPEQLPPALGGLMGMPEFHFPWANTFRLEGDLAEAVTQLKEKTPRGVLVGSPTLSAALERLGLFDEYRIVVHPVLAGHGPTLFQGLPRSRRLELVSTQRLTSGAVAMHYRRRDG